MVAEVDPSLTVAYVDDIRDRLMLLILQQKGVRELFISFDEDDGVVTWKRQIIRKWIRCTTPSYLNKKKRHAIYESA